MNLNKLQKILSIVAIISGLTYVLRLFGPTEAEVVNWGYIATTLGIITLVFALTKKKNILITNILIILLTVIQMPAVFLWFMFSGTSISDGSPASEFVASWIFAIPHILIVLLGFIYISVSIKKLLISNE